MILLPFFIAIFSSTAAQSEPFRQLIFTPESQRPHLYFNDGTKTIETKTSEATSDENIKLDKAPVEFFELNRGRPLFLKLDNPNPEYKIQWILNGSNLCSSESCGVNTYPWKKGNYKLILQITMKDRIVEYWTKLRIIPSTSTSDESPIDIPLIENREPQKKSARGEFIGRTIHGTSFIHRSNRNIKTSLGRKFSFPSEGVTINTSTKSLSQIINPGLREILIFNKSSLKFEGDKIKLRSGAARFKVNEEGDSFSIQAGDQEIHVVGGSDVYIKKTRTKVFINVIEGHPTVILNQKHFLSLHENLRTLLSRQIVKSEEQETHLQLFPNQGLYFHLDQLKLSSNARIKIENAIKKSSPNWVSSEAKQLKHSIESRTKSDSISKKLSVEKFQDRGEAYLQLGLLKRSRQQWKSLIKQNRSNPTGVRRTIETFLLRGQWQKALSFTRIFKSNHDTDPLINYYHGVTLFMLDSNIKSKQQFKRTLWLDASKETRESCQWFLDFIEENENNQLNLAAQFINNNNVLRAASDIDLPSDVKHRSSLGAAFQIGHSLNLSSENNVSLNLVSKLNMEQWSNDGLSDLGYLNLNVGLKTNVRIESMTIAFKPYIGRTNIGSFAGLDHFGVETQLKLNFVKFKPLVSYDHSKNLDPAANDESYIDPITRLWTSTGDRSRQIQLLTTRIQVSDSIRVRFLLEKMDFRAEEANIEDSLGFGLGLSHHKDWSYYWNSQVNGHLLSRNMEARSDQEINLEGLLSYRWSLILKVNGFARLLQNGSSENEQSFSQMSFGIGVNSEI